MCQGNESQHTEQLSLCVLMKKGVVLNCNKTIYWNSTYSSEFLDRLCLWSIFQFCFSADLCLYTLWHKFHHTLCDEMRLFLLDLTQADLNVLLSVIFRTETFVQDYRGHERFTVYYNVYIFTNSGKMFLKKSVT